MISRTTSRSGTSPIGRTRAIANGSSRGFARAPLRMAITCRRNSIATASRSGCARGLAGLEAAQELAHAVAQPLEPRALLGREGRGLRARIAAPDAGEAAGARGLIHAAIMTLAAARAVRIKKTLRHSSGSTGRTRWPMAHMT